MKNHPSQTIRLAMPADVGATAFRFLPSVFGCLLLLLSGSPAGAQEDSSGGWHVLSGKASISELEFASGDSSFRLHAGDPPTEIARLLTEEEILQGKPLAVRFWILPVADASGAVAPSLSLLGAEAAFVAEEGKGRIHVFDGDDALPTDFFFEILDTGEATHWIRIAIEYSAPFADEGASWQLAVNGESFNHSLAIASTPPQSPLALFFGNEDYDVFLDDFAAGALRLPGEDESNADPDRIDSSDSDGSDSPKARRSGGSTEGAGPAATAPNATLAENGALPVSVIYLSPDGDDSHDVGGLWGQPLK